MPLLGAPQEVAKKRAKTFPLGSPCDCRSSKMAGEKDIKFFGVSLAGRHHERQAEKVRFVKAILL
jgi:hypothetical protein